MIEKIYTLTSPFAQLETYLKLDNQLNSYFNYFNMSGETEVTIYLSLDTPVEVQNYLDTYMLAYPNYLASLHVTSIINSAITFGSQLVISFAAENMLLGITQANKTKDVADYLANVLRYIQSGSLYEVINEINRLEAEGLPSELSPFITTPRLLLFKNKVEAYLGIPLSE